MLDGAAVGVTVALTHHFIEELDGVNTGRTVPSFDVLLVPRGGFFRNDGLINNKKRMAPMRTIQWIGFTTDILHIFFLGFLHGWADYHPLHRLNNLSYSIR